MFPRRHVQPRNESENANPSQPIFDLRNVKGEAAAHRRSQFVVRVLWRVTKIKVHWFGHVNNATPFWANTQRQGAADMQHPTFFDQVPRLLVGDPLAECLGAAAGGRLEYGYADAVRLAGHSCPNVATAYVLGHRALTALYPDRLPERGGVRIEFAESQDAGVTGVTAAVLGLLTGAAHDGGFKGLGGRFVRRDLQRFGCAIPLLLRFTRLDTGAAVDAGSDLSSVPADPDLPGLMQRCLDGTADAAGRQRFAELWQRRVERLLLEHWDDDRVFTLRPVAAADGTPR